MDLASHKQIFLLRLLYKNWQYTLAADGLLWYLPPMPLLLPAAHHLWAKSWIAALIVMLGTKSLLVKGFWVTGELSFSATHFSMASRS